MKENRSQGKSHRLRYHAMPHFPLWRAKKYLTSWHMHQKPVSNQTLNKNRMKVRTLISSLKSQEGIEIAESRISE